jgi:transcriptional regulator of acetoin/glycerol metabolism
MGSAVFMAMKESTTKRIVDMNLHSRSKTPNTKLLPQISQTDKKDPKSVKIKRTYIAEDAGLKRHLLMARNALKYELPVFIEGARGSGKKATATQLHKLLFCEQPFVEIKCNLLTAENYEKMLFGEAGRLAYFQPSSSVFSASLLDKARNGSLFLNGIEALPIVAQKALTQVLEERQEAQIDLGKTEISAVFSSSRLSFTALKASEDLDPVFLEALQGSQIVLPHLSQRFDFRLLATELLYRVSPSHKFSKSALDALHRRDWPGHVKQLKRTIQMLLANADGPIIRASALSGGTQLTSDELTPCISCCNSPVRKESCVLIKKTWLETGGNVSLVSRRLGISRTTIYKHLNDL